MKIKTFLIGLVIGLCIPIILLFGYEFFKYKGFLTGFIVGSILMFIICLIDFHNYKNKLKKSLEG